MVKSGDVDQRWQDLLRNPREEVHREIKSWLDLSDNVDKANVAKAMLALANSGGGQILIGYEEVGESWEPDPSRPHPIDHYDQDTINGIVEKFAEPQFHCEVYHIEHPESGEVFPIIDVPGDHRVPIRSDSAGPEDQHVTYNTYYIRRPGPESAAPKTGREWDELIRRCVTASRDDLLDRMRTVLTGFEKGPSEEEIDPLDQLASWTEAMREDWEANVMDEYGNMDNSPYRHGYWSFAYSLDSEFDQPSLSEFLDLLREVKGHETGWPAWLISEDQVHPRDETIEGWYTGGTFDDPAHADYWRASPDGMLFLLRGYQEDSKDELEPGTVLDYILPIWRVGECLLHAKRLGRELGEENTSVTVQARWTGLEGRTLGSIENRRGLFPPIERESHQATVTASQRFTVQDFEDALPEVVETLTQPLYQIFDFYEPPSDLIQNELDRMQSQ